MILWVHSYLCQSPRLWIGAFASSSDPLKAGDVILDSEMAEARLEMLYKSTLNGRPLGKEIVNHLHTGKQGTIFEPKKLPLRLTFFEDTCLCYRQTVIPKVIICLSFFIKRTQKTEPGEIDRAVELRDLYLRAKKDKTLQILDCR